MRSKTAKYYMQRKKILPTEIPHPRYETGTLHSHHRPVEAVNPILLAPESPGTKVVTEERG